MRLPFAQPSEWTSERPPAGKPERPASGRRVVLAATASTALAIVPPTLVGALAVQLRADLDFDEMALGGCAAAFFAATAATSVLGGRFAERLGASKSMVLAAGASIACLLGAAIFASSYWHLVAFLVIGGAANGVAQPGCNLALARGVVSARQGVAFGFKQSAVPMASLVAGASVPLLAIRWGWRPALAAVAVSGLAVLALVPRRMAGNDVEASRRDDDESGGDVPWAVLLLLAGSCCLGTSAAIALGTFAVDSTVADGVPAATAGWVLTGGAVASIAARLASGWAADRWQFPLLVGVAMMLLLGAGGYGLLSTGTSDPTILAASVTLAFAAGWGWPALFALTVVRLVPQAPAVATGVTQTGGALGGVIGPLAFGAIASATSYDTSWRVAAGWAVLAALGMLVGQRLLSARGVVGPPGQVSATAR